MAGEAEAGGEVVPRDTTVLGVEDKKGTEDATVLGEVPKGEEPKGEEPKGEETGAPEKYEDFKVLEGRELDAEGLKEFHEIAKDLDLSQEQAQKLVDFQAKFAEAQDKQVAGTWAKMRTDWLNESKADAEIGGQKYDESIELAKKGLDKFGTPKLRELFDTFGIGNHPEVIRAWAHVGGSLGEDGITPGGGSGGETKTLAERIFSKT